MLSRKTLIILLCNSYVSLMQLLCNSVSAQYYLSGNSRPTISYRSIKTDNFFIVYPHYYENNAQILARILDTITPKVGSTLTTNPEQVPILIHTRSAKSNGLTVWAPKRMEFWTTTPPNTYAYPYLWQLAIHEYRHTAQMSALNVGTTKVLSTIFGEHIVGAISGVWLPNWLLEGDAVVAETALAPTGRGQTPEYNMFLKAQILDKGRYSADKMLLGSMKDFVPDPYNLGYFLVSYARQKYGKDIWGDYLNTLGKKWWKFDPWHLENKDKPLSFNFLFQNTIDTLEKIWAEDDIKYQESQPDSIIKQWGETKKYYCNYQNPVQINDSTILALKTSKYETQHLVRITNNKEEEIIKLPYLLHSYFDYKDNHILYSQYSPSIRWEQETFADIIDYDLENKEHKTISSKATLFTPVFSDSDSVYYAIMTDDLDNQSLSVVSSKNLENIAFDYTVALSYPAINTASGDVFVIVTDSKGKAIIRYNKEKEIFTPITAFSYDNIKHMKVYNNRLYFLKDTDNRYQIISINLSDYNDVQIHSNSRYGIENYCIYNNTIVLSDYTADGYRLISIPYTSKPYQLSKQAPLMPFTIANREQENFSLTNLSIDSDKLFPSSKYSKFSNLFNFHSWLPAFINIEKQDIGLGASLMSQNLLCSSVVQLSYLQDIHNKENKLFFRYTYSGHYPIFDETIMFRPRNLLKLDDTTSSPWLSWDEINIETKITLPFTWVARNFANNINLSFYYSLNKIINSDLYSKTLFNSIGYQIANSHLSAKAQNDINPRLGVATNIKYLHTLTSEHAYILSAYAKVFLPGLARNHSLSISASLQYTTPDLYYFPSEIPLLRGLYNIYPESYNSLLLCYAFPFAYPDGGIKSVLYFKRLYATPFFNIASADKNIYHSFGSDVQTDVHVLKISVPINLGIRLGYLPEQNSFFSNFLFNINF
ncbi:MAG: hypothetical protein HUK18_00330 [Bacteroidales bacterium]|nr:hypothetical protein [Bacteroidales bacterium]